MKTRSGQNLPLIGAIALFWAWIAAMAAINISRSGAFAYDLDDAYIHLAIARNWADFDVWGVTRYEWGSTTSSILWTSLLAILMKLGVPGREWLPLWLNLFFGTAILVVVSRWWRKAAPASGILLVGIGSRTWRLSRYTLQQWVHFLALIVFMFVVPLPEQVQNGMEHLLQILLTLLVCLFAGNAAAKEGKPWGRDEWALLLLVPLMTAARYENLFVVAAVLLVLAWRRRWGLAVVVFGAALLPLVLYGWISIQNGWYPLPNSVLLKAGFATHGWQDALRTLLGRTAINRMLFAEGHQIVPLVTLAVGALIAKIKIASRSPRIHGDSVVGTVLVIFLWTLLLHAMFNSSPAAVSTGRYTGYFFAIALSAFGYLAVQGAARLGSNTEIRLNRQSLPNAIAILALAGLVAFPFAVRVMREAQHQWFGSSNIYEQHVQMGRFLNMYYTGASVAANDIGAINYFADIRCLDLIGLGSLIVAQESRDGQFVTADIDRVARSHNVTIAILYDKWFPPGSHVAPPAHWITVAHWTISDNIVAGSPTVTFYATSPAEAARLRANLDDFAAQLPPRVAYQPTEVLIR